MIRARRIAPCIRWPANRAVLLLFLASCILPAHLGHAQDDPSSVSTRARSRLGLSLGIPQTLAITYEYAVASPIQLQANVGTTVFYSSASGRVLVVPDSWRLQPYAFVGGGALYSAHYEGSDGDGWTGFLWTGAGLRLRIGPLLLFGELGEIAGLNESKDYDSSYTAGAVGFLVQF